MAASAHADSHLPPLINALNASVKDSCSQMVHSGDAGSPAKSLSQDLVTGEIPDSHKSVDMDQLVLECSTFPCQKDGMVFSESSAKSEEIFEASKVSKDSPHIATNAVGMDITLAFQNMSMECGVSNAKVSRPPWRIPPVITEEGIKAQPVMGATVWPALTEARNMKPSDIGKSKAKTASSQIPPASLEVHHECLPDGSHKQQGEKYRPPFRGGQAGMGRPPFQVIENGTASVQPPALGLDRVSHFTKHNLHMQLKNNSPLKQVTDSDQFHGNDGGKFFNNSRKWKNGQRDHGKNNSGYQQQQKLYENGSGNVTFLQEQHVGPRNMPRPPQRFLTVRPPVFPFPAFPHTGMHYAPPGTTMPLDFLHGTPYIPLMLPVGGMILSMDPVAVRSMLVKQLDYYFSVENLCKDVYLRKHMDAEGFVPVSLIAQFNKVRDLLFILC
ncbi:hypothetical protein KP509_21G054000 [Ceratopteris richardii]|uniref:HTH La-type RNA-binding domain-containing protein n=1 Tax=Ceratopteris richardii TaxID=49495 RepID=A0A8T2SAH7_CERRI|nr:hypothetical protein KP509_21G054000 [Ceratopteris richardii]